MTLQERINELVDKHGGLRAAAEAVGIDASYMCRLRSGERASPEGDTLRRLGLRKVATYERIRRRP